MAEYCDRLITPEEMLEDMVSCGIGKAPGLGGLPYKLYRVCQTFSGQCLHELAPEWGEPQFSALECGDTDQKGPRQGE